MNLLISPIGWIIFQVCLLYFNLLYYFCGFPFQKIRFYQLKVVNDLDNYLELVFEDLSYMESLGLYLCLLILKYYLDVPSYVNIIKKLSKKPSKAICPPSKEKTDYIIVNDSIIDKSAADDDSIEMSQSRIYEQQ